MTSSVDSASTGVRHITHRRLQWAETDAAGHNHFSAAVRWLEEGEHDLWFELGLSADVVACPRVHLEINFHDRIYFAEAVEVTVGIARIGNSSITYSTTVRKENGSLATTCSHTVAYCPTGGAAERIPDRIRNLLEQQIVLGA